MCLCGFHDFLDNFYFWDLQFLDVYGVYLIYMDGDLRILVCREVDYLFFLGVLRCVEKRFYGNIKIFLSFDFFFSCMR